LGGVFKLPTSVENVFALSQEWSEFYSKDYIKVGVLEGLYYTKEGEVTEEWKKLQVRPYLRKYPPFYIIFIAKPENCYKCCKNSVLPLNCR
jgi:hypothetical protein